jgi:methylglutaconyl-CoA hydratase
MNRISYTTIRIEKSEQVTRVILNRPEVHNAFNAVMINELNDVFSGLAQDDRLRVVILTGDGKSFCAGADLKWMKEIINYSYEQNLKESLNIAELLYKIYSLPKPTIALVNGAAIGGGTGFLSACDMAIAAETAQFGLSEVKIGLVPAAISPFVVRKIGESKAREYFFTGKRITADTAKVIGLVNDVVSRDQLEKKGDDLIELLLTSGPDAIACCKELLLKVPQMSIEEAKMFTAEMIAKLRISEEGQEGMAAFLEKRKPKWVDKRLDISKK